MKAAEHKLVLQVFDENRLTRDDFLGMVEIPLANLPKEQENRAIAPKSYPLRPRRSVGYVYLLFRTCCCCCFILLIFSCLKNQPRPLVRIQCVILLLKNSSQILFDLKTFNIQVKTVLSFLIVYPLFVLCCFIFCFPIFANILE